MYSKLKNAEFACLPGSCWLARSRRGNIFHCVRQTDWKAETTNKSGVTPKLWNRTRYELLYQYVRTPTRTCTRTCVVEEVFFIVVFEHRTDRMHHSVNQLSSTRLKLYSQCSNVLLRSLTENSFSRLKNKYSVIDHHHVPSRIDRPCLQLLQ